MANEEDLQNLIMWLIVSDVAKDIYWKGIKVIQDGDDIWVITKDERQFRIEVKETWPGPLDKKPTKKPTKKKASKK